MMLFLQDVVQPLWNVFEEAHEMMLVLQNGFPAHQIEFEVAPHMILFLQDVVQALRKVFEEAHHMMLVLQNGFLAHQNVF